MELIFWGVVGLVFLYFINRDNKDEKNIEKILFKYQNAGYNFVNRIKFNRYLFTVDKEKQKLLIILSGPEEILLDFKNIIGFEIINDGQTITKASLGAPIIGGLVFGAAGAITGGIIGNKTTKEKANISLVIQLNSFEDPIIEIFIANGFTPASMKEDILKEVGKLVVWFKLILEQNEKIVN